MQKRTDFFDNSLSRIVPDIPLVIRNKPHNNQLCADLSRLISAYPVVSHFLRFAWQTTFIETNIILFVLPVVYYVYMTVFLIKTEEKWLSELYGQEYEEYCKNVNRCIPWTPKRK